MVAGGPSGPGRPPLQYVGPAAPAQQQQEPRGADERRYQPDRQLLTAQRHARYGIHDHQEYRPGEERGRQQHAMVGADQQARDMRYQQAHQRDNAAKGHRDAGQQRSHQQDGDAPLGHVEPQELRLFIAQHQYVDVAGQHDEDPYADDEQRRGDEQRLAGIVVQAAQQPDIHLAQAVAQRLHQRRARIQDGADGEAG